MINLPLPENSLHSPVLSLLGFLTSVYWSISEVYFLGLLAISFCSSSFSKTRFFLSSGFSNALQMAVYMSLISF